MATLMEKQHMAPKKKWWETAGRILALLVVIAISVILTLERDRIGEMPVYGYPAVFLVSLLGNASLILPAPSFVIAFVAGSALNPVAVGIVAGLGASLGEMTGYLAGFSGNVAVNRRPTYQIIKRWMDKSGTLVIFLLGAIPNFFFDIGGIIAGAVRMPVWRFLLAAWAGKSIRMTIIALTGNYWL